MLKPGGRLVVFDGDFVRLPWRGRLARKGIGWIDRWTGAGPHRHPDLAEQHDRILGALPFAGGLSFETLRPLAEAAGFEAVRDAGYGSINRAQRRAAGTPQDWLRTWTYRRFVLSAVHPSARRSAEACTPSGDPGRTV